jgi:CRISPR/Cas system-associated exonuclease Cas4 (RecB family)
MIAALIDVPIAAPEPPLDPIGELQKTVSASRLSCFLQCRLKFCFRYVQKIKKPPTPSLHVGSVVHGVLQSWNLARWRKQPFNIEALKIRFELQWIDLQKEEKIKWGNKNDEEDEKSGAWSLLEAYFIETPIKANEIPEGVEVPVEADLAIHGLPILRGIMDLVRAGGVVVDFKTAAQTPKAENALHQHEIQTTSYSVLYREATGHKESGIELHHLVKLKTPKIVITGTGPMTEQKQSRLFKTIESYVNGLERQDFIPSPGLHCSYCEFFNECRRWS